MKTKEILNQLWLDFAVVDHTRHILIQVIDFHVLPGKYNQMNRNAISEMNTIHNGRLEAQGSRLKAFGWLSSFEKTQMQFQTYCERRSNNWIEITPSSIGCNPGCLYKHKSTDILDMGRSIWWWRHFLRDSWTVCRSAKSGSHGEALCVNFGCSVLYYMIDHSDYLHRMRMMGALIRLYLPER